MENKYNKILDIEFKEVDIGLEKTEFIQEYSKLSFNGFFFVKSIESENTELKSYLNSIHKPLEDFDINISFQSASIDAKDFIFNLIKNKSLKKLSLSFYDEDDYLTIDSKYDSFENFRKLYISELNKIKLQKRLYQIANEGSIYDKWNISDRLTSKMIDDFIGNLFDNNNYRIFELSDWNGFDMGWYVSFLFINLEKSQITFFAKDDYD
ncbi:hypothetical protein ACFOWU_05485 [Epilithonimonas zeae]|uniref:Uncharacterized protein n=1 Tax=Epilithonimonas zeae TaxID=1416779 RepID=A0A1N6FA76_9FLAO|nr:hypothetical protein [Epilithonimonas zeae]SIN92188.1 hypothetical protein SAMN05444409_1155 [Epilithonimonas zeae]